jgi:PAS domain S-box-containing protein
MPEANTLRDIDNSNQIDGSSGPESSDGARTFPSRLRARAVSIALGLAVLFWLAETLIHVFVLRHGTFLEEMFPADLHDMWLRSFAATTIFVSALVFQSMLEERRCVEEGLRASLKLFRTLSEASGVGIFIFHDLKFRYVNPLLASLFGYEPEELVGKLGPMELTVPEDHDGATDYIRNHLSGQTDLPTHSFRGLRKDRSRFDCEVMASRVLYEGAPAIIGTLLDVTRRRKTDDWIQGLNDLKEHLLVRGNLETKLKLITDAIVDVFDADFARVWITKPGDLCSRGCVHAVATDGPHVCSHRNRCLHLMASSGRYTHTDGETHRRVPFGCYKIGRVAAGEDAKFLTNDVTRDPRVHDHAWAKKLGLVSFAGYKLTSQADEPMGVLALFSKHAIPLDESTLLETVASTTAQVLQTESAEATVRQKSGQLADLLETARQLTSTLDTREVLTRVGAEAKDILRAYGCAIYLLEDDGETLKPVVALEPPYEEEILSTCLNIDTSFTGQAVKAKRGLIFNDSAEDVTGHHIPGTEEHEDENIIAAPFLIENSVVGAMCLSRLGSRFSRDDLALAETFAVYAATALKNARTYEGLHREMEKARLAEEALRESEERFRRVFNRVFDACVMADEEKNIVLANDAALRLLGYTRNELLGLTIRDIHPADELKKIDDALERALKNQTDYVGETAFLNSKGARIPVEAGIATVNTTGKTYVVGSFRDISESKKAEETLRVRAHLLTERIKELRCLSEITSLTAEAGRSLDEVLEKSAGALITAWQYPEITCVRLAVDEREYTSDRWKRSEWMQRTDIEMGGRIVGSIEVAYLEKRPDSDEGPFLKEERELMNTLATLFADFLQRKRTEEALLEQASFVMNNPAPVFQADRDGKIAACNPAATDLFEGNLAGAHVSELFPRLGESTLSRISYDSPYQIEEDIEGRTLLLTIKKESTTQSLYIYGSDITDRKIVETALAQKAEELVGANAQLERANVELLELDRMKSDFLSNVSHELRTPLAAVKAYAETLADYRSIPEEKRDSFMNIIIEQSERLSAVIEDLLDLSRIEAGKLKLCVAPLHMEEAVEAAMQTVSPIAQKKNIDVRVELSGGSMRVLADEQRLVQVLVNLLSNAVKFTGQDGVIELSSTMVTDRAGSDVREGQAPAYVRVTISDNGEGIPPEELRRIFDKFKQVADSTKGKPGGTGLGLSICRELVENMKGRIWVESTVGKGSDFHFTLPLAGKSDPDSGSETVTSCNTAGESRAG